MAVFIDPVRQREQIKRPAAALHETARREYELRLAESRVASDLVAERLAATETA